MQGETANCCCEIDNSQSELKIIKVISSLVQTLNLRADDGRSKLIKIIKTTTNFPGLEKHETALGANLRVTPIYIQGGEPGKISQQEIQPTSNGKIVNSNYYLEVNSINYFLNIRLKQISRGASAASPLLTWHCRSRSTRTTL